MTLPPTSELPVGYRPPVDAYDELFDGENVRGHWSHVAGTLDRLGPHELTARANEARQETQNDDDDEQLDQGKTPRTGGRPEAGPQGTTQAEWVAHAL